MMEITITSIWVYRGCINCGWRHLRMLFCCEWIPKGTKSIHITLVRIGNVRVIIFIRYLCAHDKRTCKHLHYGHLFCRNIFNYFLASWQKWTNSTTNGNNVFRVNNDFHCLWANACCVRLPTYHMGVVWELMSVL